MSDDYQYQNLEQPKQPKATSTFKEHKWAWSLFVFLVLAALTAGGLCLYFFVIKDDGKTAVTVTGKPIEPAITPPVETPAFGFGNTGYRNTGFGNTGSRNTGFGDEDESEVQKLLPGGSFPGSISIGNPTDALKQHLSKPRMGVVLSNSATNLHSIRGDPEIDTSTMEKSWGIMQSAKKMDQQYGRDRHVVRSGFEMKTQWKSPYDGHYPKIGEK